MHTIWKGSIQFGLVNIPVKMYAATEEKGVRSRYLHQECLTPIRMIRICPKCEQEVPWEEVVRGFEYSDGEFIAVDSEKWEELTPDRDRSIHILDFVELQEIDPIYFDKTYYLGPQFPEDKAYVLLRQVLQESGKMGVAQVTIRSRQSLAALRAYQDCIVMETMFYPSEIRDPSQVPLVQTEVSVSEEELEMAYRLIEQLTTRFDPVKYQNKYRHAIEVAVEKKIGQKEAMESQNQRPEKLDDLMQSLKTSLEGTPLRKRKIKRGFLGDLLKKQ